ncbi:MAG: helix-hairpin-helix domain-containing protein [Candidatus Omnitrophica bacterium]|nr:helix-hairpin-helix domain-containing protein [Candidatus Omnitrophota bacterium]MBU4346685.1 helix-hairpin-helix domain-containing protein [Candidatus Omnitrophota bacterium]
MFNLTPQERQVILFLTSAILLGIGINFLVKRCSHVKFIAYLNQDIGKADLNKADKEVLIGIPGIGEKMACRIIEYRREHGGFKDREELKKIKGIGNSKYKSLKDYFFLGY